MSKLIKGIIKTHIRYPNTELLLNNMPLLSLNVKSSKSKNMSSDWKYIISKFLNDKTIKLELREK